MSEEMDFPKFGGWNYRMATKMNEDGKSRLFSIIEVYYDADGNPTAFVDTKNPLADWQYIEDLVGTVDLVKKALSKDVIDLDNFPNTWQIVLPG